MKNILIFLLITLFISGTNCCHKQTPRECFDKVMKKFVQNCEQVKRPQLCYNCLFHFCNVFIKGTENCENHFIKCIDYKIMDCAIHVWNKLKLNLSSFQILDSEYHGVPMEGGLPSKGYLLYHFIYSNWNINLPTNRIKGMSDNAFQVLRWKNMLKSNLQLLYI